MYNAMHPNKMDVPSGFTILPYCNNQYDYTRAMKYRDHH